jgi:2-keto-4-pentenoate hydratase/2-oxohepta-3-ene-1,7-dioic acid hydratase in catechol pathway
MKFARISGTECDWPTVIADDGSGLSLSGLTDAIDWAFLANGGFERTQTALDRGALPTVNVERITLASPIVRPGLLVCIGLNYRHHAEEAGAELPAEPILFMKSRAALLVQTMTCRSRAVRRRRIWRSSWRS